MRLLCMSDLHGEFPVIKELFKADVAVIAGDIVPALVPYHQGPQKILLQTKWIIDRFMPWTQTLPVEHVVMIWGNHDQLGDQEDGDVIPKGLWPKNVHLLTNEALDLNGVTFYGVPQTPRFFDWAFNEDDTPKSLGQRWNAVPNDTDVLVSHGPPYGACDRVYQNGRVLNVGSRTQRAWLESGRQNVPRVVICGHIHSAHGTGKVAQTDIHNVALVNERYKLVNGPLFLNLEETL